MLARSLLRPPESTSPVKACRRSCSCSSCIPVSFDWTSNLLESRLASMCGFTGAVHHDRLHAVQSASRYLSQCPWASFLTSSWLQIIWQSYKGVQTCNCFAAAGCFPLGPVCNSHTCRMLPDASNPSIVSTIRYMSGFCFGVSPQMVVLLVSAGSDGGGGDERRKHEL